MTEEAQPKKGSPIKEFFAMSEVFGYFFRSKDPNRPKNFSLKAMHTINKISMLMFLVGMILFGIKMWMR